MRIHRWFSQLSFKQHIWLFATVIIMAAIVILGALINPVTKAKKSFNPGIDMSIRSIAPQLAVTGKALARELNLPLDITKKKPLRALGVTDEELQHVVQHLLSHRDATLKYYVYAGLVLWGVIFLVKLGRPEGSDGDNRSNWYPRTPYVIPLFLSVIIAGFFLGKSPNPMEGIVKVFKCMAGLYPDPGAKIVAFGFFIVLAVVGNKMICGWACPFGALQELIYSLPILPSIKQHKLPFSFSNTIRAGTFLIMLLFLFGIIGGHKGTVIYHYVNPFNLFNWDFESISILLTVIIALAGSIIIYRPFCQLICPFGFISWIAERLSITRIRIDKDKCIQCGACIKACPLEAAKGRIAGSRLPADCFSCARCLNVCPVDALHYTFAFKDALTKSPA